MKPAVTIIGLIIIGLISSANAQTLGVKKSITLKVTGYECGDFCYLGLKDIVSGIEYDMDNIDEKTKDNGILESLQNIYYEDGGNDKKLIGKTYKAIIEYRKTDIWRWESTDAPPIKTGKKKTMWMINSLTQLLPVK
jgi:hypothetical protein